MNLFKSTDSRYMLKTALLITMVPAIMIVVIAYSSWLLLVVNHSYFVAHGLALDEESREVFLNYLLISSTDDLWIVWMVLIGYFLMGLLLGHMVLRPFKQVALACEAAIKGEKKTINMSGLNKSKLLLKLGEFLVRHHDSMRRGEAEKMTDDLAESKAPRIDYVFYVQFFSLILILMGITVLFIHIFTEQLHMAIVDASWAFLKGKKTAGLVTFLSTQKDVLSSIVLVPSVISISIFIYLSRIIISKVEGVTFGCVRDVKDIVQGNRLRRLKVRIGDPGLDAVEGINSLFDDLYPERKSPEDFLVEPPPIDATLASS
jgi:hypothetical protein